MCLYNLLFHESRGARFVNVDFVSFTVFIFRGMHRDLKKKDRRISRCTFVILFPTRMLKRLVNLINFRGFLESCGILEIHDREECKRTVMTPNSNDFIMLQNCSRFIFCCPFGAMFKVTHTYTDTAATDGGT